MPPAQPVIAMRLYHNPRCSKSRAARQLLEDAGVTVEIVNYLDTPTDAATLAELIDRLEENAEALVRTGDALFAEHRASATPLDRERVLELLVHEPALMQRPVLDTGRRAFIARPPERVLERVDTQHARNA